MKIRPIKLIIISLLVILLILFLADYLQFRISKIDNLFYAEFKENIVSHTSDSPNGDSFYIQDLTPFTWDKMYIIRPYTTKEEMQKILGIKWTTANTYPGYLWDKTYFGNNPLDDDIFHKLVFVNKGKVILDITIMRDLADFTYIDDIVIDNKVLLQIDKSDTRYPKIKRIDI